MAALFYSSEIYVHFVGSDRLLGAVFRTMSKPAIERAPPVITGLSMILLINSGGFFYNTSRYIGSQPWQIANI